MSETTAPTGTTSGTTSVVPPAIPVPSNRLRTALPWIASTITLLVLPLIFKGGTGLSVLNLMGIAIIFALSYNMMLGQTGMLSFGHAVYFGLGAYFTIHFINWAIATRAPIPLPLVPLVGGLAGLFFACIFGWLSTKRSGTTFSMISLGLAELVGSSALILRTFFGGEEGVTTNRTKLLRLMDWNFGSQIQMYYLIATWCLLCALAMYAITRTPFGRMSNAVRENPERVQFVGYSPQMIRYIAFCLSGFFAGIAGALNGINFEIANAALFGAAQSGNVLLATFIGGVGSFVGPVLGAVLVSYLQIMLSDITEVWQLYFGLMFIGVVMFAPGGIAGLTFMHAPLLRAGVMTKILPSYLLMVVPAAMVFVGLVMLIEMTVQLSVKHSDGPMMKLFGVGLNASSLVPWAVMAALVLVGCFLCRLIGPRISAAWDAARVQAAQKGIVV
jgi:branched-chain amino acid transport system permease protein